MLTSLSYLNHKTIGARGRELDGWLLWSFGVWHSVPKRAFYGTEYACRAKKGLLWYATHLQKHSV